MNRPETYPFDIETLDTQVDALWWTPPQPRAGLLLAHGAGAGMNHPFMSAMAQRFFDHGVATLRFQFPYMHAGKKRPDPAPRLRATVEAAYRQAQTLAPKLPWLAGGKSMGGRIASHCAAEGSLPGLRGLVFLGFPLHPPGKPSQARAAHLQRVTVPMLFLQGTRDTLARLEFLTPVCEALAFATLHLEEGADHGFHVLKRSGRTDDEVQDALAQTASDWLTRTLNL